MNLQFSARGLAFLGHYISAPNEIRYYLRGIYVAAMPEKAGGGVLGAATDGHVLALWHDKEGTCQRPAILRVTPELLKAAAKPNAEQITIVDNRLVCMATGGVESYVQPRRPVDQTKPNQYERDGAPWEIVGNFPVVSRVIPVVDESSPRAPTDEFALEYLGRIAKSMPKRDRKSTGFHYTPTFMRQAEAGQGILMTFPTVKEAAVVLMPMRGNVDGPRLPDWIPAYMASAKQHHA